MKKDLDLQNFNDSTSRYFLDSLNQDLPVKVIFVNIIFKTTIGEAALYLFILLTQHHQCGVLVCVFFLGAGRMAGKLLLVNLFVFLLGLLFFRLSRLIHLSSLWMGMACLNLIEIKFPALLVERTEMLSSLVSGQKGRMVMVNFSGSQSIHHRFRTEELRRSLNEFAKIVEFRLVQGKLTSGLWAIQHLRSPILTQF